MRKRRYEQKAPGAPRDRGERGYRFLSKEEKQKARDYQRAYRERVAAAQGLPPPGKRSYYRVAERESRVRERERNRDPEAPPPPEPPPYRDTRDLTAQFCGDPMPGRSALDQEKDRTHGRSEAS